MGILSYFTNVFRFKFGNCADCEGIISSFSDEGDSTPPLSDDLADRTEDEGDVDIKIWTENFYREIKDSLG